MHAPLSIGFSTIATTSRPYSSGRPIRFGKAASLVNASANSFGMSLVMPVEKRLGAIAMTRMPRLPKFGHGQGHSGNSRLGGGVGNLSNLSFERGDGRSVDDDPALAVVRFVRRHVVGFKPVQIEGADQVHFHRAAEFVHGVWAIFGQGAPGDAAAGRIHGNVESPERIDRIVNCRLTCVSSLMSTG